MDSVDNRYEDLLTEARNALTAYDAQLQADFLALWKKKLLDYTAGPDGKTGFMLLVDWDGWKREKEGKATANIRWISGAPSIVE